MVQTRTYSSRIRRAILLTMLQRNIRPRLKFLSLLEERLLANVYLATMDLFSLTARQDQGKHLLF